MNPMIEIIAGVYVLSFGISLFVTTFNYFLTLRFLRSKQIQILNQNLSKIGKYWSHTEGALAELSPNCIDKDQKKSLRQILWLGLLGLGSAPGCLLLIIVTLSLRILARPRLEKQLMESELCQNPELSSEVIRDFLVIRSPSSFSGAQ